MSDYGVALFYTTSSAVRAEKVAKKADLVVRLIPVPRELSSDCGLAMRFGWAQVEEIKALLTKERVEVASIHPL
jgi:hypothetical protein